MVLKLALTGAKRYVHRLRNLSVALCVVFILTFFFLSLFHSLNYNLRCYWVDKYLGGDLIVSENEDFFDLTTPVPFENYVSYREFIKKNPNLEKITSPRIRVGMLLESSNENSLSRPVIITGIDYEKESNINNFINIIDGRMLHPGKNEIVLSRTIANYLSSNIGDKIYVFSKTVDSYDNADILTVVGFYETVTAAGFAFGDAYAYINLSTAKELLQTDLVSEFVTYSSRFNHIRGQYTKKRGIDAVSLSRTVKIIYDLMFVIIVILLLVFSAGIVFQNITIMNEERKDEVAVYLTYGVKPQWLQWLMMFELIIYTALCSVFGVVISLIINIWLNSLGLFPVDIFSEILLGGDILILSRSPSLFLVTWFSLTLLVLCAAYHPVGKSVKELNIVQLFMH